MGLNSGLYAFITIIYFNSVLSIVTDQSATEADGEILEGILNRKHEWESTTKKASNRYLHIYNTFLKIIYRKQKVSLSLTCVVFSTKCFTTLY